MIPLIRLRGKEELVRTINAEAYPRALAVSQQFPADLGNLGWLGPQHESQFITAALIPALDAYYVVLPTAGLHDDADGPKTTSDKYDGSADSKGLLLGWWEIEAFRTDLILHLWSMTVGTVRVSVLLWVLSITGTMIKDQSHHLRFISRTTELYD